MRRRRARNLLFACSATTHVETAALARQRSEATLVWNGHSCPLSLTLTLLLIRIATRPHAAPWKSGASAPREASKTNAGFQPPRCAAPPRFCHSERAEGSARNLLLHAASQLMWRQPPRRSAERSQASVERTLLSVAFDLDVDFDFKRPDECSAGAPAGCPSPTL